MKAKLTVTIDRELLPAAKQVARRRGVSLSSLIEEALRELVEPAGPGFAERWRGAFRLAERDEERYRALVKKYE